MALPRFLPAASLVLAVGLAGACSGDRRPAARIGVGQGEEGLRADASRVESGPAMEAVGSLLESAGAVLPRGGVRRFASAEPLGRELEVFAAVALRAMALESGAGLHLVWSPRTARLAGLPGAPPDRRRTGTNHDDVLEEEWEGFEELTDGRMLRDTWPSFASFRSADPRFVQEVEWRKRDRELETLRWDRDRNEDLLDLGALGHGLKARVLRAQRLLVERRGSAPGRTPEQGMEGLLLLQQALALEEMLRTRLVFDGAALGLLDDPAAYDPGEGLRYFAATVTLEEEDAGGDLPPRPRTLLARETQSSLAVQAALLEGLAELAWLAAPEQPDPGLRDLFQGRPFGEPPDFARRRRLPATQAANLNFTQHVAPILNFRCLACHGPARVENDFRVTTYEDVLRGGTHRATNPTVVPFDAQNSLLWQVVALQNPPITQRMPYLQPPLPQAQIDTIRDWIDQGAVRDPEPPRPPQVPGRDLARVLVRNLSAMHLEPSAGVLVAFHDGRSLAPSSRSLAVDAAAAGAALAALAAAKEVLPDERGLEELLAAHAGFTASRLVGPTGAVVPSYTLGAGPDPVPATLLAQARVVHGLLQAWLSTAEPAHLDAALAAGRHLVEVLFEPATGLFVTHERRRSRLYTPSTVAATLAALRSLEEVGGLSAARGIHDRFAAAVVRGPMVLSEWDDLDEVVGDGIPDTDGNGIREAPLAGGPFGTAPVFARRVLHGPDPGTEPFPSLVSWARHVKPLFRNACSQCHMGGALEGGYSLETWESAFLPGDSGGRFPLIVPGDPAGSLLFQKIDLRTPPVGLQMPLGYPPLSPAARALVALWIRQGARNN